MTKELYEGDESETRPRGRCYELAANTVLAFGAGRLAHLLIGEHWAAKIPRDATNVVLVHGTPVLARPPYKRYGHAWVELHWWRTDWCVDGNFGSAMPKDLYYRAGQIEECHVKRYTKDQATEMILKHKHYGRWEDE